MAILVIESWASDFLCPAGVGIVTSIIKLGFCVGVVNSGPHACETSKSPTDPSPQLQYLQFNPHSNAGKEKGDLVMPPPRILETQAVLSSRDRIQRQTSDSKARCKAQFNVLLQFK